MKKLVVLGMVLCLSMSLVACGGETTDAPQNVVEEESQDIAEDSVKPSEGYALTVDGVTYNIDADMDALQHPEAKSVFEAPSCAGQGTDYIYDFGSFQVETYPLDGKNLIGLVTLKDDMVATTEGVDLSMTKEDILRVYGTGEEDGNKITYKKGDMKLNFILDGDTIVSIEYVSSVIG